VLRITVNIVGFQLAWWTCVLSARADAAWLGIGVAAAVFALHLAISPARASEAWFIPLAAVIGYLVDSAATLLGALRFDEHALPPLPTPLWIMALWLAFATTINTTFAWLRNRPLAAALLGAASGPLAYAAGAALGVVTLPSILQSTLLLALLWGITVPLLVRIAARTRRPPRAPHATALPDSGATA
jgi:hypothetical protein